MRKSLVEIAADVRQDIRELPEINLTIARLNEARDALDPAFNGVAESLRRLRRLFLEYHDDYSEKELRKLFFHLGQMIARLEKVQSDLLK